jgi:serine/threonine protein kinase
VAESLKSKIRDVVEKLHDYGFVHGDIREVNIFVDAQTPTTEDDISIHLIDFDWAGKDREVRYPGRVNTATVSRPDGVSDGKLITKGHDMDMVSRLCSYFALLCPEMFY